MASAKSIQGKIDAALKKYGPPFATVYKRTVTRTGGDALIGRQTTTTNTDTLLSPQPTYARAMRRQVGGADAQVIDVGSNVQIAQRYEMVVSVTALSQAELQNPDLLFVFKDSINTELYKLDDYEPIAFQGTVIGWLTYVVSASR